MSYACIVDDLEFVLDYRNADKSSEWSGRPVFCKFNPIRKERDPYPIQTVDYTHVEVKDNFRKPRMETNRQVTLPYGFGQCEEREHFHENNTRLQSGDRD